VTVIVAVASLVKLPEATVPKLRLVVDNAVHPGVTVALTPIEVLRVPAKTGLNPSSVMKVASNHLLYLIIVDLP